MQALITPTAYFPPAQWFTAAVQVGCWQIEAHETYQRRSTRNRAEIAGPNGRLYLTVPLGKGKHQSCPIRMVQTADEEDWKREHAQSIKSCYGRAPYFEYYADELLAELQHEHESLFVLNQRLIQHLILQLNLPIELTTTDDFTGASDPRQKPALSPYPQVFTDRFGYRGGLSILDALFCLGPTFITHPLADY